MEVLSQLSYAPNSNNLSPLMNGDENFNQKGKKYKQDLSNWLETSNVNFGSFSSKLVFQIYSIELGAHLTAIIRCLI